MRGALAWMSGEDGKHCRGVVVADVFGLVIGGRLGVSCCASRLFHGSEGAAFQGNRLVAELEDTGPSDGSPATAATAVSGCLPGEDARAIKPIVRRLAIWVQAGVASGWCVIAIGQKLRFQLGYIAIKEDDDFGVSCVYDAAILSLPEEVVVATARSRRSVPYRHFRSQLDNIRLLGQFRYQRHKSHTGEGNANEELIMCVLSQVVEREISF